LSNTEEVSLYYKNITAPHILIVLSSNQPIYIPQASSEGVNLHQTITKYHIKRLSWEKAQCMKCTLSKAISCTGGAPFKNAVVKAVEQRLTERNQQPGPKNY
jgi:hypothetical protein